MYNPGSRSTLGRLWNDLGSHACVGIFEDEILAGAKGTAKPAEDVPEPYDHAKNLTGTFPIELGAKSLILWVYDVLMNDRQEMIFLVRFSSSTAFSIWQPKNAQPTLGDKLVCI